MLYVTIKSTPLLATSTTGHLTSSTVTATHSTRVGAAVLPLGPVSTVMKAFTPAMNAAECAAPSVTVTWRHAPAAATRCVVAVRGSCRTRQDPGRMWRLLIADYAYRRVRGGVTAPGVIPGTCRDEYASNCACSSGFTGKHCQTITTNPTIHSNLLRLTASNGDITEAPPNINSGSSQSTSWSNINSPSRMYYKFTAEYKMVPPSRHAFIEDFRVGIVSGSATFKLKRGTGVVSTKVYNCGGVSRSSPDTDLYTCEGNSPGTSVLPLPFQHRDVIKFTYATSNGGYVKVRDNESITLTTYYYNGATQTHTFTVSIDLVDPYHCTGTTACVGSMLTVPDVIKTPTVNLRWSGWSDADAGVDHFVRDVYELHAVGDVLRNMRRVNTTTLTSSTTSNSYTLTEEGVYSVVLTAYDKAGNHRSTRRILIYDGTSSVTTQANTSLRVTTASSATSVWQTTSSSVTADWTNRYINTVHHNNKWLHGVASVGDISSDYDDKEGDRSVAAINNVQGVTRFLTSYKLDHQGGSSITSPPADNLFTSQGLNQSQTITPSLVDGDTVRFLMRAYDIKSEFHEEHVTVHIDTSPPVMENLWLNRSGILNISIHRVEELQDVKMEFDVRDEHSGVETLVWRVVEKRQDEDTAVAVHHIFVQGYGTLEECYTMHDARDGNCYCTPAGTCYHSNYQVKPALADIRDVKLAEGKDYWFQVTATNHAKLKSEQEVKIQVNASPLQSGFVYDGQSGQPEVDYQDSLQLHAHWEGFFDRESAIAFYQYTFGPRCLQGHEFDLNSTKNMESTRTTEATWTAPSCGKFYITVVAYNGAQQRSDAVCSDGVETCKPSPFTGSLVLIVSVTASAVVVVAVIVIGVVVWKRKQRDQPKISDQAVRYNIGSYENVKPAKTKPEDNNRQFDDMTYDKLDVNLRDRGPDEEPYCSIQTRRSDETNTYECIDSICETPQVMSSMTSSGIREEH
ncbi:uncharacterized protein LOC124280399 isoform X2 [Haliotis rubra]|uniref:uncharacterized protein LOC124280399 isoform X2 n=2 Tax=Haliotis rubra TaxID=36100 RepID=UPI001EE5D7CF|nr:uncharacterized protein LOC124280399 isoform X2 [Haliotis rubra]XP_046572284.1 uncharacterized protein LOC124280399 isoform X2 [Haliotis rubra]XP_046572294.1 uncharacterized protein LOC124280399 isoform X2 [Haliotis rubra]